MEKMTLIFLDGHPETFVIRWHNVTDNYICFKHASPEGKELETFVPRHAILSCTFENDTDGVAVYI